MKKCPVCNAVAFDDATRCFGCLHTFNEQGDGVREGGTVPARNDEGEPCGSPLDALPVFTIRFTPRVTDAGVLIWKCAVEA